MRTSYEEDIQLVIHEAGELLLENVCVDHPLFLQIAEDVIDTRKNLYKNDPEKYTVYLLWACLKAGDTLADAHQWQRACPYLQSAVELINDLAAKQPDEYDRERVIPTLNLATAYSKLKEYAGAAKCLTDLFNYFEPKLPEHPEYHDVLVSLMFSLTENLLLDGQKERARYYITRAIIYFSKMNNSSEQTRLKRAFEKLINDHFPVDPQLSAGAALKNF